MLIVNSLIGIASQLFNHFIVHHPNLEKKRGLTNVVDLSKNGCFNGRVMVENELICSGADSL